LRTMTDLNNIYATPRAVSIEDCEFYHVMDLPGFGRVGGQWDLRGRVDEYLGHVDFRGKRVLEIGPASGFLTIEMERRGAEVVAVEITDNPGWDLVPYPPIVLDAIRLPFADHMGRIKRSFWLTHKVNNSSAKLFYGDAANLPTALGAFDIAVMAAVLLHARNPVAIIEECAKHAETLVIIDRLCGELEGSPVCRLVPTRENKLWHTWWNFSTDFLTQFLAVISFDVAKITKHHQIAFNNPEEMFTIVASRRQV
jgi:2-polyprenyl-3-methyl-5-hydroxy-6-metoxy-1,4-benzoquinol methylase